MNCGGTINILNGPTVTCGGFYTCRKCQNTDPTITVTHPGPFYCPHCNARMADRGDNAIKCLMMTCENYGISWDLPKIMLTRTKEGHY